jgi:peptide/nickel transport system permease protein
MSAVTEPAAVSPRGHRRTHPVVAMIVRRLLFGVVTLLLVSILVFAATELLPGNAVSTVLGGTATPGQIKQLEAQLHLNEPAIPAYWHWLTALLSGNPGTSLVSKQPVWQVVSSRLVNSAILVALGSIIGSLLGVVLGVFAASRRGGWFDQITSTIALVVVGLPEFVKAVLLVIVFATVGVHAFPAVSTIPPGSSPLGHPSALVLPTATLVMIIFPYIFRMARATTIEALESDYVEMAALKGLPPRRTLFAHALPNALGPTIQVVALNLVYLAGGIVVIEYVFNYPGIGESLVSAVNTRDIPVIQLIVLLLAGFYVIVNIVADVLALWATPRRRLPRSG